LSAVPKPLRNWAVPLAILFLLVVFAAAGSASESRWTNVGQQVVAGLSTGAIAALAGTGLVVAYRTTGVFNFAFAGIATISAFVMYEFTSKRSMPVALGLVIVVLVIAPAIGALMDLVVFRALERRSAGTAEKLVANLGVLIFLLGIGGVIYGEVTYQPQNVFSANQAFQIGSGNNAVSVSWTVVGNVGLIVGAAGALILLFRYTRLGRQIRAVVDRRTLAELNVVNANLISTFSWAVGAAFAGLAGVLDAPVVGLQNGILALQVLQIIVVAVIAKLRNIGAAVAAGLGLGVVQALASILVAPSYPSWLSWLPSLNSSIQTQIPAIALLVFLLVYRTLDESGSGSSGVVTVSFSRRRTATNPATTAWVWLGTAVVVLGVPALLSGTNLATAQEVVAYAVAFLSIVAITGYSGHIMLGAAAFGGIGAYVTERLIAGRLPFPTTASIPHVPLLLAMLIGGLVVIPLGILIGYPALRRRGLILGLITLAFAVIVNAFVFQGASWQEGQQSRNVSRPNLFGWHLTGDKTFLYFELVVLGLILLLVRNLRSGALGRILGAMRDSERGAVTVGISLRRYKLLVFGAAAFIAAIGGSLLAQQQGTFNFAEDGPYAPLSGLFWFGAVVVFGLSYRYSAILAAVLYVVVDVVSGNDQASLVAIGVIALFIGYMPGGIIGSVLRFFRGDGIDDISPAQRSLAAYALRQQQKAKAPPPGSDLQPSAFAERVLAGER
jgi:branched-chain amino acid transport system permease protein